jgi:type I restriction enzyme M protein
VERPLRLRFQITEERLKRFLDAAPHLEADIQCLTREFETEPHLDWNLVWQRAQELCQSKWKTGESKLFRDVFTERNPEAEPVIKSRGKKVEYESDAELRDFENVPLKVDVDEFFRTEVLPHVPDAWMNRSKDKIGYEINFNRLFYVYTPPRSLTEIDAELRELEGRIVKGLRSLLE